MRAAPIILTIIVVVIEAVVIAQLVPMYTGVF